jgi:ABC-2 type transport system permease protein
MIDPLISKSMRDLRGQVLGWGIGMAILLGLTVALYPSVGDVYEHMIDELPEGMLAFFGPMEAVDRLEGYLNVEFFTFAPLALAVFAILAGTASIAGEEAQGTLDLLLAQPLSRLRCGGAKLAALTVSIVMLVAIMATGLWIALLFIEADAAHGRLLVAFLVMVPFLVALGLAAALLTQVLGSRMIAGTVLGVLVVASYILDALSTLNSTLATLRPVYLTTYFQGEQALVGELDGGSLTALVAAIAMLGVGTLVLFDKRDIGTGPTLRLSAPAFLRRRRGEEVAS